MAAISSCSGLYGLMRRQSPPHIIGDRPTSNISRTLVENKIDDHSHVVGASPVGAAGQRQLQHETVIISVLISGPRLNIRKDVFS